MTLTETTDSNGAIALAAPDPAACWRFGRVEIDERERRLVVAGSPATLDRSSFDLLLCLVRHAGSVVGKDELLRVGWPGRVVTENSLTKAIGRLRLALDDADGEFLRVVHGYGYRLVADVCVQAIATPAAESTPHAAESGAPPSPSRQPSRRWWMPVIVGTILLLAAIGAIHVGSQSSAPAVAVAPLQPQPAAPSIAVMPFLDLSEARDQAYFSDGLAEQLLDALARVPSLRVVARTSSFALRGTDLDLPAIGRKLNAQTVLEGSVRKSAERVRVTVQLVKAIDGYHVWSETYDRPVTELFAMQDEIVRAIVSALRIELMPELQRELVRHATTSAEAYDEYLLAHQVFKDDETAHRRSIAHYERAIALDPQFIDAWVGLAGLLGYSGLYADNAADALAGKRRALEILDRVVTLAPDRPELFLQRGVLRCAHWWDWPGAEEDFEHGAALSSADNEQYLLESGRLKAALGQLPAALARQRRLSEVNPQSTSAWTVMGYYYTSLGDYGHAREVLTQAVRVDPLDEHARYYLGLGELLQGRAAAALPHFEDSAHVLRLTGLALAHHALGDEAAADQDVKLLIARYGHILPYNIAEVYAWRGDADQAFAWLDRAYQLHDASFIYYLFDPLLKSVRGDPRYDALRVRLGLPAAP